MYALFRSVAALAVAASFVGGLAAAASAQAISSTVQVQRFTGGTWSFTGNGVLIADPASAASSRFVLTTGLIVSGALPANLRIVAGSCDRTDLVGTQIAGVASFVAGVPSGSASYPNDIAVLTLATPLVYDPNVQPARYATDNHNHFAGQTARVAGWWAANPPSSVISTTCLNIPMPVITNDMAQAMEASVPGALIWDGHICLHDPANVLVPGKGASGAGVYITDSCTGGLVLAGLASWPGAAIAGVPNPAYPTVCTRISAYADWIALQTGAPLPSTGTAGSTVSSTTCGCTSLLLSSSGQFPVIPNPNFELRVTGAPNFVAGPSALLWLGIGNITPVKFLSAPGNWFHVPGTFPYILNGVSGTSVNGTSCSSEVYWKLPIPASICTAAGTTLTAQALVQCTTGSGQALTNAWQFTLQ